MRAAVRGVGGGGGGGEEDDVLPLLQLLPPPAHRPLPDAVPHPLHCPEQELGLL